MEGAVAWSYDLLDEAEKLVFATLSVFPATFDLPAAESVCADGAGRDAFDVVDLVGSLVDKSLLQAEPGDGGLRYRMLESIADYAAQRLADLGDAVVRRAREAHALYYLGFVEVAAPSLTGFDQIEWKTKVETDFDNIRTALTVLVAGAEYGGEASGGFHVLAQAALDHADAQGDTRERAAALLTLGYLQQRVGEVDAARNSAEAGARIARQIDDSSLAAAHLSRLAFEQWRRVTWPRPARHSRPRSRTPGHRVRTRPSSCSTWVW